MTCLECQSFIEEGQGHWFCKQCNQRHEREASKMEREYMPNVKEPKQGDTRLEEALNRALTEVTCERCGGTGHVLGLWGDHDIPIACGRCLGKGKHLEPAELGVTFVEWLDIMDRLE